MLIRNARVVTRDEELTGSLRIEDGLIRDLERGITSAREAADWDGDYLLPGLIKLHTDNLEKHLVPRPGVRWNIGRGVRDSRCAGGPRPASRPSSPDGVVPVDRHLRTGRLHRTRFRLSAQPRYVSAGQAQSLSPQH